MGTYTPSLCPRCRADVASFLHVASCGASPTVLRKRVHDDGRLVPMGEDVLTENDRAYYRSVTEGA